jgi:hypothetical protein
VWFIVPCWGGAFDFAARTDQCIPMIFLKNGGAVFFGSTSFNPGAIPYAIGGCNYGGELPDNYGDYGVGTLYTQIIKRLQKGTRIGDAYREAKTWYLQQPWSNAFGGDGFPRINHLYGDPTLKIKTTW